MGRFTTIGSRTVVNNAEIGNEVEIGHKCVIGDVRPKHTHTHTHTHTCEMSHTFMRHAVSHREEILIVVCVWM